MKKNIKIFSFDQFMNEEEGATGATTATSTPGNLARPETEREAKSRIALGIVQNLFGDVKGLTGLTGGADSLIDQTKEVKESLPYKGCGAAEGYKMEKADLSVLTIKILLEYLQGKQVGDYSRAIKELEEKRAVVIGARNKLSVKKEAINQDRFCDAIYFIPGNASDGTGVTGPTGPTGATGTTASAAPKKDDKKGDVFDRIKKKKNESLDLEQRIQNRIDELEYLGESGLWSFEQFDEMGKERDFLIEHLDLLREGEITENEFIQLYEGFFSWIGDKAKQLGTWVGTKLGFIDEKPKAPKYDIDAEDAPSKKGAAAAGTTGTVGPTPPASLGDIITPYQITTLPSLAYYGKNPMNPKGVGVKLPGDTLYVYKEATLGGKNTYKMLVEYEEIKVGRYPVGVTKFETYKPADTFTESCGMHIHRSSTNGSGVCVGPWSAGCQVFSDVDEWKDFTSKIEKESMNGGRFVYALIQLDDIPPQVMASAMIGLKFSEIAEMDPATQQPTAAATGPQVKPGSLKKLGRVTED